MMLIKKRPVLVDLKFIIENCEKNNNINYIIMSFIYNYCNDYIFCVDVYTQV